LSTLADLFNNRISFSRRIVLAELFGEKYFVYLIQIKGEEPFKVELFSINRENLAGVLFEHGVSKEDLYVTLHPRFYFKASIQLPFNDPQKIEAIINNEIIDYIPFENESDGSLNEKGYVVDFEIFYQRTLAYSVRESVIERIISDLGNYADNLKAIVPYGAMLRNFFTSKIFTGREYKVIMVEDSGSEVEVWGFSPDVRGEIVHDILVGKSKDEGDRIISAILRIKKYFNNEDRYFLFLKSENISSESFEGNAKKHVLWEDIETKTGLRPGRINLENAHLNFPYYEIDYNHHLILYSFLNFLRKKDRKINLLKGSFKPSIKNYIRVKDFVLIGFLLLALLGFSVGRFFSDISFLKNRVQQLESSISALAQESFGRKLKSVKTAIELLNTIKNRSELLEKNISRKYSALEIFKEFTSALPVDVELEYTDILIEQNRIRFSGKTKSFADIDRIRESLRNSDYFKEVKVTNSGTTGSTGGFIVNFQFDIQCKVE